MNESLGVYASKHKNPEVRAESRSGGVFTALSDYVLQKDGVVFGCVLSEDLLVKHTIARSSIERDEMRGSKYVQSNMGDTFREVKNELENEKLVLFSGTPCQVAGLKTFLGKNFDNLICIDILCHGVSSPKILKDYLEWQKKNFKNSFLTMDFRNKIDYGWAEHVETLYAYDGSVYNSRVYTNLFYSHCILRPICYECKYKSIARVGDISLGDYWGIEKAAPGFNDNKGVSLVLLNSEKGKNIFGFVKNDLDSIPTDINLSLQPALQYPFHKPENREKFWIDYKSKGFNYVATVYGDYMSISKRITKKLKSVINKIGVIFHGK